MIQANQLRVGNWVDYNGKYYKIYDGIRSLSIDDLDSEKLDSHLKNIKLSELQPIPLTEEILLKCGFNSDGLLYEFRSAEYVFKSDFKYVWIYDVELKNCICLKCEHLYHLQNLIFTFTNQELGIKL